jgi:dTDP-glucose 4,6-dehydratase
MKTVLITGAAGFLGQHIAHAFAHGGMPWRVVPTDRIAVPLLRNSDCILAPADLQDGLAIADILRRHKITHVIHAAINSADIESAGDLLERNVVPALTLLEACKTHWSTLPEITGHFHYVSCADVLQANENGVVTDDAAVCPESLFAATKGAVESFLLGYAARYRFQATISYPTHLYGTDQPLYELIPDYIDALLHGRRVPLFGDGKAMVDLLNVRDAAIAIRAIVEAGAAGRRYGIRGTSASHAEILATLCRCIDQCAAVTYNFSKSYTKSPIAYGKASASLITRVQDRRAQVRPRKYLFGALSELLEDFYPRPLYDGLMACVSERLERNDIILPDEELSQSA